MLIILFWQLNAKSGNPEPDIMEQVEKLLEEVGPSTSGDDECDSDGSDDKENVNVASIEDDIASSDDDDCEMQSVGT